MNQELATAQDIPAEKEVISWIEKYSNWGRWGPRDQLGTMNFLTPEKRLRATKIVQEGVTISCQRPIEFLPSSDYDGTTATPAKRFTYPYRDIARPGMLKGGFLGSADSIWIEVHSGARTHLDSPSHSYCKENQLYNGYPTASARPIPESLRARGVPPEVEESQLDTAVVSNGVVARGVLLDIARLKGKDWLDPGEPIFPKDLDAAEKAQGVTVEEGDVPVVRSGLTLRRLKDPITFGRGTGGFSGMHKWPGLHAACIPWLFERRVSMVASDVPTDVSPSGYPNLRLPVHLIGLGAMGTWLLEGCDLEELTRACQQRQSWQFMLTFAPWRASGFTGMPVNPIAVF